MLQGTQPFIFAHTFIFCRVKFSSGQSILLIRKITINGILHKFSAASKKIVALSNVRVIFHIGRSIFLIENITKLMTFCTNILQVALRT